MFNLGAINTLAANVLNSIDSAAKETLEEHKSESATLIRQRRKENQGKEDDDDAELEEQIDNADNPDELERTNSKSSFEVTVDTAGTPSNYSAQISELKKLLRQKNKEIEKLNAECLELEDHSNSMKKEISEAWDSYKSAQEKAAAREDELQDEIKQIQKAKQLDRQQMINQVTKLTTDMEEALEKVRVHQKERDEALLTIGQFQQVENQWKAQVEELEREISELRSGSVQGVHTIREELANALQANEVLRSEHASILRMSQTKQSELEQSNAHLSLSVAEKQREISKLKTMLQDQSSNRDSNADSAREFELLQLQVSQLTENLTSEQSKSSLFERRIKQLELEAKAASLAWEEERSRKDKTISELSSQVGILGDKLKESTASNKPSKPSNSSIFDTFDDDEVGHLKTQIQDISKQLLKKQGQVVELQAERSALKSRVQDLQARCNSAERQLAASKDVEEDEYFEDPEENGKSTSYGSLRRRGGDGTSDSSSIARRGKNNMVNGLETLGVKPAPGVAKAVEILDSWTLLIIRLIRSHPLVRLGIALYLLVLHVWVIIVLAIHTHALELDTDPKEAILLPRSVSHG